MWLLRRKRSEVTRKEEWEDFKMSDFVDEAKQGPTMTDGGGRGGGGGQRKSVSMADTEQLPGMSAHPADNDLSFEQLMKQYRDYEREQRRANGEQVEEEYDEEDEEEYDDEYMGEEEEEDYEEEEEGAGVAATAGTAGSETTDGAHGRGKRRASMSRREILQSRGGDGTKGSVGRVQTGDVQRKAELREPKTPGAADKRRKRTGGDVRFGEDSDGPSRPESRAIPSRTGTGRSSRPMTGRSSIADRSKLDDEPMGDALYHGAKGFLDYSKRELNSIPMGAYSGAALGGKPVLILWAHDNKIKFIPEVVGLMTALTDLRLHDNQIDKLPEEFGNLASIRRLWLNNNILEKCPDTLGKLTTLEMLSLSNNPFTELSTGIGNLARLKDLMLDGLKLEVPPREIIVRGPNAIVDYLSRVHGAYTACIDVKEERHPDYSIPETFVHKFDNQAGPNKINDSDYWRKRYISADRHGMMNYSTKQGSEKTPVGYISEAKFEALSLDGISYKSFRLLWDMDKRDVHELVAGGDNNQATDLVFETWDLTKHRGCVLQLQRYGLVKLPLEVMRMDLLVRLDISSNMLRMLPKLNWFCLEELILDFNHMTLVPKTIYEDLTAIRVLSLIENPLTRLPTDLGQMPKIEELRMNVHFTLVSPPSIVLSNNKQLGFLRSLKQAEKTGAMNLIDFDLNVLPREISSRWDEHPEYHGIVSLSLKQNDLTEIDSGVDKWGKLTSLDLSDNKISRLPYMMQNLLNLSDLKLNHNQLLEVPKTLRSCVSIALLALDYNQLREWPGCLESLTNLVELSMSHNRIDDIPPTASTLVKLQILKLNGNRIASMPKQCSQWSRLIELQMKENGLSQIPETLGLITSLEQVNFGKNSIDSFPTEVGNWVKLKSLDLSWNLIPYLPVSICNSTNVKRLLLEGNPLIQIPLHMGSMQTLKKLTWSGKKWISPPQKIMEKSSGVVIKYLQHFDQAKRAGALNLSDSGLENLHSDVLSLQNLRYLDLSKNKMTNLTVVTGEADGRFTYLKGDTDVYVDPALLEEKLLAKEALMAELGEGLNTRQLKERAEKVFKQIDTDRGGSLDMDELGRCFRRLRVKVSKKVLRMLVADVSNDGDDSVDMEEWVRLVNNIYRSMNDWQGVGDMLNLEELNISDNKISRLPYGIGMCKSLKKLIIGMDHTIKIPCESILRTCADDAQVCVRYMFELHEAAQTNRLHLNGFTIPAIPAEVIELENLTELNMSGSNLSNVVSEIDKIKGLKLVDFSYNRIKLLPPTIGKLKRLETLNVQHNLLKHLPAILSKIKALKSLLISGNKNLMVPPEVINAGTPTIKFFLEGIYTGSNDSAIDWSKLNTLGIVKLRRIPEVLFQMNWVSDLCLDNNSIITLPPEIKTMRSLTKLSLRGNYLETLPKELRRCGDLECLLLERNKLTNLPSYVYTMLPLRVLALANNMLDSECIPDDLPLNAGSRLQALVLDSNNIGKLSGAVGLFSSLNVLSFSFNTVESLPDEIAENQQLTDLQLDGNKLSELPKIMSTMVSLQRIKLNDNRIVKLPTWIGALTRLKHLALANNKLQYVPYDITKCPLKVLTLDGNPLVAIESGVLAEGAKGIVDYLRYNNAYDLKDKNILPPRTEQRLQINAEINSLTHQMDRLHAARMEATMRNLGGTNLIELSVNKQIGDRVDSQGAVILDEKMLDETRIIAEREMACNSLFIYIGNNLVSAEVKARAMEVFHSVDEDGGGTLDMSELRECFKRMGVKLSDRGLMALMIEAAEDPKKGITVEEFQMLVYTIYSSKS